MTINTTRLERREAGGGPGGPRGGHHQGGVDHEPVNYAGRGLPAHALGYGPAGSAGERGTPCTRRDDPISPAG